MEAPEAPEREAGPPCLGESIQFPRFAVAATAAWTWRVLGTPHCCVSVQDVPPSFTELMKRANVHLKKVVSQVSRNSHAAAAFETLLQEKLQEIEVQVRVGASLHPNGVSDPTTLPFVPSDSKSKSTKRARSAYEGKPAQKRVIIAVSVSLRCRVHVLYRVGDSF